MKEIIHVGFSKSSSTFLQSIFSRSNQINFIYKSKRFSLLGEPKLDVKLSNDKLNLESDEHILLPDWHPDLHRVRVSELGRIKKSFEHLKTISPHCKLIIVFRNQYTMITSRYSQYIVGSGGHKSLENFIDDMIGVKSKENYFQNYYFQITQLIEEIFGKENALILFHEEVAEDLEGSLKKINDFCETTFESLKANIISRRKGLSSAGIRRQIILNKFFVHPVQPNKEVVKTIIPFGVYKLFIRINRVVDFLLPSSRISMNEDMVNQLKKIFSQDNKKLSEYLNKDLEKLGYK